MSHYWFGEDAYDRHEPVNDVVLTLSCAGCDFEDRVDVTVYRDGSATWRCPSCDELHEFVVEYDEGPEYDPNDRWDRS